MKNKIAGIYKDNKTQPFFYRFNEDEFDYCIQIVDANGEKVNRGNVLSIDKKTNIISIYPNVNTDFGLNLDENSSFPLRHDVV